MTENPVTVTYPLEQILSELKQSLEKLDGKIDKLSDKVDKVQVDLSDWKTETKVAIESVKGDIKELKTELQAVKDNGQQTKKDLEKVQNTSFYILAVVMVSIIVTAYKAFLGGFSN